MAQTAGAHSSYDEPIGSAGNREDLSDVLYDISPTETPFLTIAGKGNATGTKHEWLIDALADPAENAHIEGNDAAPADAAPRGRLDNYTQIFAKHAVVTGTQEKVLKGGGIKSEMAYQIARRMKEMKRDAERAFVGPATAKAAGSDSVARRSGSFQSYMNASTYFGGAGFVAPAGNGVGAGTAGTNRPLTEAIFKAALQSLWTNSGGNENIVALCGANQRSAISGFTGSSTRYVTTDDKKLTASINVYDGDFHTVTVQPDRYCDQNSLFLVDKEYVKIADLRPIASSDLAKTGDSMRKQIIWEATLEVCNPKAHVLIAALT